MLKLRSTEDRLLPARERSRRGLLLVQAVASVLCAGALVVYAIHGSMPANAVALPRENQLDTILLLPEGWAFFTRDPREPRFLVFSLKQSGEWERAARPSEDLATTIGFSRRARSLNVEAALLVTRAAETDWERCTATPEACLALRSNSTLRVVNHTPSPALCGPIGVVQQDRVPWAWAASVDPASMPSRIVRMDVTCPRS